MNRKELYDLETRVLKNGAVVALFAIATCCLVVVVAGVGSLGDDSPTFNDPTGSVGQGPVVPAAPDLSGVAAARGYVVSGQNEVGTEIHDQWGRNSHTGHAAASRNQAILNGYDVEWSQ